MAKMPGWEFHSKCAMWMMNDILLGVYATRSGKQLRSARYTEKNLPRQLLSVMNEFTAGAICSEQGKFNTGLGTIRHFQLSMLGAELRLHPSGMDRVHLDVRVLQLGRKVDGELIQGSLGCIVRKGLHRCDRAIGHCLQRQGAKDARQIDDSACRTLLEQG